MGETTMKEMRQLQEAANAMMKNKKTGSFSPEKRSAAFKGASAAEDHVAIAIHMLIDMVHTRLNGIEDNLERIVELKAEEMCIETANKG